MSNPLALVASDLDRTLIYSKNAMTLGDTPVDVACVEMYQERQQSFSTVRSLAVVADIAAQTVFVPVTTRTPEQYRRVQVTPVVPEFAICSNGGDLLVNGEIDMDWHHHIHDLVAGDSSPLSTVVTHLEAVLAGTRQPARLHQASDLFAYAVFDTSDIDREWVASLTEWADGEGFTVSAQGRKVYCVPRLLRKSRALAEVMTRTSSSRALAAGDSLLDKDLLAFADLAIRPAHGELDEEGWTASNLQVTASAGILAGQEISEWFLANL